MHVFQYSNKYQYMQAGHATMSDVQDCNQVERENPMLLLVSSYFSSNGEMCRCVSREAVESYIFFRISIWISSRIQGRGTLSIRNVSSCNLSVDQVLDACHFGERLVLYIPELTPNWPFMENLSLILLPCRPRKAMGEGPSTF